MAIFDGQATLHFFLAGCTGETTMMEAYNAWEEKRNYGRTSLGCIRSTVLIDADGGALKPWDLPKLWQITRSRFSIF